MHTALALIKHAYCLGANQACILPWLVGEQHKVEKQHRPANTFLTKYMYLSYLLCISRFGPTPSASCAEIFPGSSHTSDFKIGTPVATLPAFWRYRVSAGTGRPGVSILRLGEVESLVCNFYLSVAARKVV